MNRMVKLKRAVPEASPVRVVIDKEATSIDDLVRLARAAGHPANNRWKRETLLAKLGVA